MNRLIMTCIVFILITQSIICMNSSQIKRGACSRVCSVFQQISQRLSSAINSPQFTQATHRMFIEAPAAVLGALLILPQIRTVLAYQLRGPRSSAQLDSDLALAVVQGEDLLTGYLLSKDANPNVVYENTPILFHALEKGYFLIAQALIKSGADVTIEREVDGSLGCCLYNIPTSPLMAAIFGMSYRGWYPGQSLYNKRMIQLLIDEGAAVCANNNEAIRKACSVGLADVVEVLAQNGADVNAMEGEGDSMLKHVISRDWVSRRASWGTGKHFKVLQVLLRNGATFTVSDFQKIKATGVISKEVEVYLSLRGFSIA